MDCQSGFSIRWTAASAAESVIVITKSVAAKPSRASTIVLPVQPCTRRSSMAIEPCPLRRAAGHVRVDRQCTQQRHQHQDHGRQRGQHAGRVEGDRRLIAERAEIIDTRQAHHPQPEAAMTAVACSAASCGDRGIDPARAQGGQGLGAGRGEPGTRALARRRGLGTACGPLHGLLARGG